MSLASLNWLLSLYVSLGFWINIGAHYNLFHYLIRQFFHNHFNIKYSVTWYGIFFFLKEYPHHVIKYADCGELTGQLCIPGIKRNIWVFFFYEHHALDASALKRMLREICSWLTSIYKSWPCAFEISIGIQVHSSKSEKFDGLPFIPYGGRTSCGCHHVSATGNSLQKEGNASSV